MGILEPADPVSLVDATIMWIPMQSRIVISGQENVVIASTTPQAITVRDADLAFMETHLPLIHQKSANHVSVTQEVLGPPSAGAMGRVIASQEFLEINVTSVQETLITTAPRAVKRAPTVIWESKTRY